MVECEICAGVKVQPSQIEHHVQSNDHRRKLAQHTFVKQTQQLLQIVQASLSDRDARAAVNGGGGGGGDSLEPPSAKRPRTATDATTVSAPLLVQESEDAPIRIRSRCSARRAAA